MKQVPNIGRIKKLKQKSLLIICCMILSTLILVSPSGPISNAHATSGNSPPLLRGWGGVGIAESDQNTTGCPSLCTAPTSAVFSGERASNMEQAFLNLTSKGLNAERVLFYNHYANKTLNQYMVNNGVSVFNYTDSRLSRSLSIAQHFGVWLVLNEHESCDWSNSTTVCHQVFGSQDVVFKGVQGNWTSFWQNNVTRIALNSGYTNFIYEPLNEPISNAPTRILVNGVWVAQPYPGRPENIATPYQTFINLIRNTVADSSHYIIISNAASDGDFPSVTDSANRLMLTHHFYNHYNQDPSCANSPQGRTQYLVPSYSGGGTDPNDPAYSLLSFCGTWGITNSQKFADNETAYLRAVQTRFGLPVISTEAGADFQTDCSTLCPPDVVLNNGSCQYSKATAAFVQEFVNDLSQQSPIGYQLWTNGNWSGTSTKANLYGCISGWGGALNYPNVATTTSDRTVFESSYQRFSFYARGLVWLFYENGSATCEHQFGCLSYTTSSDGSTWASPTNVNVHVADSDYSIYSNNTSVFYSRYNETNLEGTCNEPLQFRVGTLSTAGTVSWQSEQTVIAPSTSNLYADSKIIVDTNNQAWIAYLNANAGFCGGTGTDYPHIIHSSGTNYASWSGDTILTTAHSNLWHIDLAALPNGQVYAAYWVNTLDLHGKLYNGSWGADEQVSASTDQTDVNSFLFNNGNNPYAIWYDATSETIRFGVRSSAGTWTVNNIGTGEATATSINQYSLPITATYNPGNAKFYFFWYNTTGGHIDQWVGTGASWTKTSNLVANLNATNPESITSFTTATPVNGVFTFDMFYIAGPFSPYNVNAFTYRVPTSPADIIKLSNDLKSPIATAPESQQRVFQNTRGTQATYVFYTSGPTSGTCQYAYSVNGGAWTTGLSTNFGSYFSECSVAYREDPANSRTIVYAVSSQYSDGVTGSSHNILFNIGTISDTSSTISWVDTTPQAIFTVSSTQATEYPVIIVDGKGYLLTAFSYLNDPSGTKSDAQNVVVCGSSTKLPTSNPTWTCSSTAISCTVGTNCPFANTNEANSDDAKYMPQLVPDVNGFDAVVIQGHCEGVETVHCHSGQTATQEQANTVTWTGTTLSFGSSPAALSLSAPTQDPADQRSVTINISSGTIFFAYANGTSNTASGARLILAKIASPYTSWTTTSNLEVDNNAVYLAGIHLSFDQAAGYGILFYNYATTSSNNNALKSVSFNEALSTSTTTVFYSNATFASRWVSTPMIIDNTTLTTNTFSFAPLAWVNEPTAPELWFQPYAVAISKQTGSST